MQYFPAIGLNVIMVYLLVSYVSGSSTSSLPLVNR